MMVDNRTRGDTFGYTLLALAWAPFLAESRSKGILDLTVGRPDMPHRDLLSTKVRNRPMS